MRKPMLVTIMVLSVAVIAGAFERNDRVTGILIDLSCYSQDKNDTGNHHHDKGLVCAQACAREGFEVGVLTTDGTVYHVRGGLTDEGNAKLVPYMAQTVALTGKISKQEGQMVITSDELAVTR
jgi:hypothetical protein